MIVGLKPEKSLGAIYPYEGNQIAVYPTTYPNRTIFALYSGDEKIKHFNVFDSTVAWI